MGSEMCIRDSRNLVWTFVKDMPGPLFWALLPVHVLQNLAIILYFVLRGRGRVIWRAKWDALRGIGGAWRKRRAIQSQRAATMWELWLAMDHSLRPWRSAGRQGRRPLPVGAK